VTVSVTALLVSHDGMRWLPSVLDGLQEQTRRPDRAFAVETGTLGESRALLGQRLGAAAVTTAPVDAGYGAAVGVGLAALPPIQAAGQSASQETTEWIWLLHDDGRPDPDCLERLLDAAELHPSAAIVGPKLREWPSLRRLLELGVTITGSGRRETGLERGEYDQGQHDLVKKVLAVNTAGMLVRRDVLESVGFDPYLPLSGPEIDFGWRAALAGHTTIVAPEAVVFHAEASHRGLRKTPHTRHIRRSEREAALYTLLVNSSSGRLPLLGLRLLIWGLLRPLGLLLLRAPTEAMDEVVAQVRTVLHPARILRARRERRSAITVAHKSLRSLFPPWWLPLRHGLDIVIDAASALWAVIFDAATNPSQASRTWDDADDTGEADGFGPILRVLRSPVFILFGGLVVAALIAGRGLWGGTLSGGALPPVVGGATDLWRGYFATWHNLGVGSSNPSASYLLPLAIGGTLLGGHVSWLISGLMLFAVPLAAFGALRFLRRHVDSDVTSIWAALTYGLLPVATGAVQQGRLGTVVFVLVLPHLGVTVSSLIASPDGDLRRRAAWRAALWLALAAAFAPITLPLFAFAWLMLLVFVRVSAGRDALTVFLPMGIPIAIAFLLLAPWSLTTWVHQGPSSWLLEAGWPAGHLIGEYSPWDLLVGRPGDVGAAPWWFSLGVVAVAVAALLRGSKRRRALAGFAVVALGVVTASALSRLMVTPDASPLSVPVWLGVPLVLAQAGLLFVGASAGAGIHTTLSGRSFGWRQPVVIVLIALAGFAPLATGAWWITSGSGDELTTHRSEVLPEYLLGAGKHRPFDGTLVIAGSSERSLEYVILRGRPLSLGDEAILPGVDDQADLTDLVGDLVASPTSEGIEELATFGVRFIYLPPRADALVAERLDGLTEALGPSSSLHPRSRAWELLPRATGESIESEPAMVRGLLVALQLVGLAALGVLAAPTARWRP
jgi:GT2 family glycosyltransferase